MLSLQKDIAFVSRAHDSLERSIVAYGINMRASITPLTIALIITSGFCLEVIFLHLLNFVIPPAIE